MSDWLNSALAALLQALALPEYGLSTVFVVSFVSATLLPLGSEPAVFGLVRLNPALLWPTIAVATVGNTLGGVLNWWIGLGAHHVLERHHASATATATGQTAHQGKRPSGTELRALTWLQRLGPPACLFAFLPVIGDPLCAVAGWLRLPLLPCVLWMALGKLTRYVVLTLVLLQLWPDAA